MTPKKNIGKATLLGLKEILINPDFMTNNLNLYNDLIKKHFMPDNSDFMPDNSELFNALPEEERKAEINRVIRIMQQYNIKEGWIRYDVWDCRRGYALNVYQGEVEYSTYVKLEDLLK
jgi:hypothetical protein